jgi:hypothetical protein
MTQFAAYVQTGQLVRPDADSLGAVPAERNGLFADNEQQGCKWRFRFRFRNQE